MNARLHVSGVCCVCCAEELGQIYVRTWRVRNSYRTGHANVLCNYFLIDAFMLQRDGPALERALNGACCITVADNSFPVLTTLMPSLVKRKLRPHAVHGEGSWCFCFVLFCSAAVLVSALSCCTVLL